MKWIIVLFAATIGFFAVAAIGGPDRKKAEDICARMNPIDTLSRSGCVRVLLTGR